MGTSGKNQFIERDLQPFFACDKLIRCIDSDRRIFVDQRDIVLFVPCIWIGDDFIHRHFILQHIGQHDTIVIRVAFLPDDRDIIAFRIPFQNFFNQTNPCHTVSDQDQMFSHLRTLFYSLL